MKKVVGFIFGISLLFIFTDNVTAACTQVGSNVTTCTGTQTFECSQNYPTPGRIDRFCCDTQADCNEKKEEIQTTIDDRLADPAGDPRSGCSNGINTAIGCINVLSESGPETFLGQLLKWAVGIGGGIAFLLIIYASFMIMTSSGNPERLKAGQELLTSAISGLILLVLSVFILKFIGIDILGLDQFGFGQ